MCVIVLATAKRSGFWRSQSDRRRKETENEVKKKIRAIQYGVGPIGASIARLMREKQAIEIIGAIDMDPAKVARDLGEVVGAGSHGP